MVKIYGLIDTRNNEVFYVGSTIVQLKYRLVAHTSERLAWDNKNIKTHSLDKRNRIRAIYNDGYKVDIIELLRCPKQYATGCERYVYNLLISCGYKLTQGQINKRH